MAPEGEVVRGYRFGPAERRSLIAGLRLAQVLVIVAGGVVALVAIRARPDGLGLGVGLLALAAGGATAFGRVGGRGLDEWAPTVLRWLSGIGSGRRFISEVPLLGERSGRGGRAQPPPTLGDVALLAVRTHASGEVGVIHDRRAGTYTGVVAVRGRAFALLDVAEQERRLGGWADVLGGWARDGSAAHRLQWLERTVPEDGDVMRHYLAEGLAVEEDSPAVKSYVELLAAAAPVSQRHEAYVAVTVSARRGGRAMRAAGGGERGACELLVRELRHLEVRLRSAEVSVEEILGPRQLSRVLRCAFDPDAGGGLATRARAEPELAGTSARNAFPLATETTWSAYRTEDAWHATFWVAEWPRLEVGPDFLTPLLLHTPGRRAVSVVMEPVPPSRAARAVEMAHTSYLADEELRNKAGYLSTARRRREHEAIVRREQELADGHAEYRFSGFVTVTAPDPEALEQAVAEVVQVAHQCRLDLRRLYGEQDSAFTTTLPLARGLR